MPYPTTANQPAERRVRSALQRALAIDLRKLNEMLDADEIEKARARARLLLPRVMIALSGTPAVQLYLKLKLIAGDSACPTPPSASTARKRADRRCRSCADSAYNHLVRCKLTA